MLDSIGDFVVVRMRAATLALCTASAASALACGPSPASNTAQSVSSADERAAAHDERSASNPTALAIHLSPTAAKIPGLASTLSEIVGSVVFIDDEAVPEMLHELHDDDEARATYSAQLPGIYISGGLDKLQLMGRFRTWAQGGEVPNPPPLTAVRLVALEGLEPAQLAPVIALAADTMQVVEMLGDYGPQSSSPSTRTALERAALVVDDPRALPDCVAPCKPWSWQTRWSVSMTYARAAWREGSRTKDEALLRQSERRVRQALEAIPKQTHPMTRAVSERLLGTVLNSIYDTNHEAATLMESLAITRQALESFQGSEHLYDRALTQQNLQTALLARIARSVSSDAIDDALKASQQVLDVIDQRTPQLWIQGLLRRAQVFKQQWARSGNLSDLEQAVRLLEAAPDARSGLADALAIPLELERCDRYSELASRRKDVEDVKRAVVRCESVLGRPNLLEYYQPSAHTVYGLALLRLGLALDDVATLERSARELETAIEVADRVEGRRSGASARADYAWSLWQLARYTNATENLRKATTVSSEALSLTSKESAPVQWAQLKTTEGSALLELGWNSRLRLRFQEAIVLYQESRASFGDALTVFRQSVSPKRWALLQENIGAAFAREGELHRPQVPLYNQAIASYQRALKVNRRDEDRRAFARAQFGLGNVYLIWADQGRGRKQIISAATRAVDAYRTAIEIYEAEGAIAIVANGKGHLAEALDILHRLKRVESCDTLALRVDAVRAYSSAQGLWGSVQEVLDRYDPSKVDRSKCPDVHPSFWDKKAAEKGLP